MQLYDTTLRDGSQGEGVNFSVQDKLLVTRMLDDLGFDFIEGGFAGSNEKDTEYFQLVQQPQHRPRRAVVCAFGMTRRKDIHPRDDHGLQALANAGTPACTVVGKTWDLHVTEVLRVSLKENLAMIADSVCWLREQGKRVLYDAEHFFDGYHANPEYALQTILAAAQAGAEIIVCCDTNGGSLPERIAATLEAIKPQLAIPFGIHCHNDCDVAVANSLRAVDCGAVQVQGTINGIGERCGNADLVSVAANLALKKNHTVLDGRGVQHLTELSRYVYELANMNFRSGQPFVGRSAFAHKGGMHVHAVNRVAHSYEHIDPTAVGNERRVLVSELSGRSNIVAKTTKFKLDQDADLMKRILDRVVELENEGWQFEAAEASFDLLVKKLAGTYDPKFQRLHYRVNVETSAPAPLSLTSDSPTSSTSPAGERAGVTGQAKSLEDQQSSIANPQSPPPQSPLSRLAASQRESPEKTPAPPSSADHQSTPTPQPSTLNSQLNPIPLTEATVKLKIDGHGPIKHEVAEGDGPVNALDNALRKALLETYPNLASMHLVDYKVRVINSAEGTAARVRVVIESKDQKDVWSTVGVSENIIEASWLALVDAVEYKLFKDDGQLT